MNKTTKASIAIIITLLTLGLGGCAQMSNWTPTVDPYNDPQAYRIQQDMAECQQLAKSAGGGGPGDVAINAGVGALVGAAGGAIVGAFAGNPGLGAAAGGAAGGFGGAAKEAFSGNDRYKSAYNNCLAGRGHHVIR